MLFFLLFFFFFITEGFSEAAYAKEAHLKNFKKKLGQISTLGFSNTFLSFFLFTRLFQTALNSPCSLFYRVLAEAAGFSGWPWPFLKVTVAAGLLAAVNLGTLYCQRATLRASLPGTFLQRKEGCRKPLPGVCQRVCILRKEVYCTSVAYCVRTTWRSSLLLHSAVMETQYVIS